MAATESRSASELVSLLLELARVVKARRYFEPGDARLRPLFEHARRVWAADLARHGALEFAIAADRIDLGDQSVAIDGRLEATLDEWRARGVGQLHVDADADAEALAGLVEVLALTEAAVHAKGGAGPALARHVPVGIEIQPPEHSEAPDAGGAPGDTDVIALRATPDPEPTSLDDSSRLATATPVPPLSKWANAPDLSTSTGTAPHSSDDDRVEDASAQAAGETLDDDRAEAAGLETATDPAGVEDGDARHHERLASSRDTVEEEEASTESLVATRENDDSAEDPVAVEGNDGGATDPKAVDQAERAAIGTDAVDDESGGSDDVEDVGDQEAGTRQEGTDPEAGAAAQHLESDPQDGAAEALETDDESASADRHTAVDEDEATADATVDDDQAAAASAGTAVREDVPQPEPDDLEADRSETISDDPRPLAPTHAVTAPDLPAISPDESPAHGVAGSTGLPESDPQHDETQPSLLRTKTLPVDETSQPWVHAAGSSAEDPDEDTDVVGRPTTAADTDDDEDTDVVGLKPPTQPPPEIPSPSADPPSGLSETGKLRWPKRMLKAAAARSKRLAERTLRSDRAPGSDIDDATAPNLTFPGLRSGSDTEPLPQGPGSSGRRGLADEDTLPVTYSSGESGERLLNPSDAAASLLRELENAPDGPIYAELMDTLVRLVEAEGGSLGTAATLRILAALATESDAKRGDSERVAAETAIRRLTQAEIRDALLDQAADGGTYAEGAGRILRKLGPEIVGPLIDDALTEPESERFAHLAEHFENLDPSHTTTPVLAALGRTERQEVLRAIRLAERHPSLEATGRMADLLRSDDEFVREGAARALARRASPEGGDDPQALRGLARGLQSSDVTLSVLCAECLSATGSARAVPPLAASLHAAVEEKDLETARERIRLLGELGRGEAAAELGSLLLAKDWLGRKRLRDLKLAACQALARLPGDEPVGVLSQAAQLRDRQIREAAQSALDRRTAGRSEE